MEICFQINCLKNSNALKYVSNWFTHKDADMSTVIDKIGIYLDKNKSRFKVRLNSLARKLQIILPRPNYKICSLYINLCHNKIIANAAMGR